MKKKRTKCNNTMPQSNCSGLLKVAEVWPEPAKRRQLTAKHDTLQCWSCSLSPLFRLCISILAGILVEGNLQSAKLDFPTPLFKVPNWTFPLLIFIQRVGKTEGELNILICSVVECHTERHTDSYDEEDCGCCMLYRRSVLRIQRVCLHVHMSICLSLSHVPLVDCTPFSHPHCSLTWT